jgi:hypothetical protein
MIILISIVLPAEMTLGYMAGGMCPEEVRIPGKVQTLNDAEMTLGYMAGGMCPEEVRIPGKVQTLNDAPKDYG